MNTNSSREVLRLSILLSIEDSLILILNLRKVSWHCQNVSPKKQILKCSNFCGIFVKVDFEVVEVYLLLLDTVCNVLSIFWLLPRHVTKDPTVRIVTIFLIVNYIKLLLLLRRLEIYNPDNIVCILYYWNYIINTNSFFGTYTILHSTKDSNIKNINRKSLSFTIPMLCISSPRKYFLFSIKVSI